MITYEWAESCCERPEVAELLETAADFDAEQGFSAVSPRLDPGPAGTTDTHELVAWMAPEVGSVARGERRAAAFLRVRTGEDGDGVLELVVHPQFRSLGVATLLAEQLGFGVGADGWAGTGATALRAWARGSHPAAERMARRFHADVQRSVWRIVRPGKAPDRLPSEDAGIRVDRVSDPQERDELARVSAAWLAPADLRDGAELLAARGPNGDLVGYLALRAPKTPGELGTISALGLASGADEDAVWAALLSHAVDHLIEAGAREVDMLVEAVADGLVRTCRLLGFHHDQTDLCFRLPLEPRRVL